MLHTRNPSSCIKFSVDRPIGLHPSLQTLFMSFRAQKVAFIVGCRPFIGLDACPLFGTFGGALFYAIGIDGNDGILPVTIGVGRMECSEGWDYFFREL